VVEGGRIRRFGALFLSLCPTHCKFYGIS
jgi:hypothetical protein